MLRGGDSQLLGSRYRVERSITGAMGRLLIVRDSDSGERFAAKTLREDLASEEIERRFQVEARAWMALGRHPHIVEARYFREIDGRPFLFLEYIDGLDLERLLEATGALPVRQALELAAAMFDGLAHGHATRIREGTQGLVHRDLKPANLLLGRDRRLRVTDWGLVKVLGGTRHTREGQMVGTIAYCAPEQLRGETEVDARADLFSAGAILFELLSGHPPFRGQDVGQVLRAVLLDPTPSLASLLPGCPPGLSALVAALLEKDAARRPRSASEVLEALRAVPMDTATAVSCAQCGLVTRHVLTPCPLCVPPLARGAGPETLEHASTLELRLRRTVSTEGMVEIPAGAFLFGPDRVETNLGTYWIDRTAVTNGEYSTFLQESGYRPEDPHEFLTHWQGAAPPSALVDHPVVWVSAADAHAYAAWAGKAIPSWAQWEKAARGVRGWAFPWGDEFDPTRANSREAAVGGTTPVTRYASGASAFGCLDMAGNVQEWTSTWREADVRRTLVVCGGSWAVPLAPHGLRRVRNAFPRTRDYQTGFRCVVEMAT
jgi:serine/threonine-protein kinase